MGLFEWNIVASKANLQWIGVLYSNLQLCQMILIFKGRDWCQRTCIWIETYLGHPKGGPWMPVIYNFDIRTLYIWTTFCRETSIHNKWSAPLVCMVVNLCCLVQCSREYLGFVSPNSLPGLRMYLYVCLESLLESVPITARDTSIPDVGTVVVSQQQRNN